MWRLWNKLFGWHYVRVVFPTKPAKHIVKRVQQNMKGICFVEFLDDELMMFEIKYKLGKNNIASMMSGFFWDWPTKVEYIPLTFKPKELIK